MYLITEHSIVPIEAKEIALTQQVVDKRINQIEQLVADAYNTNVSELDVYYRDSDAKLMCCFLLHHLLNYSVGSIAKKYRIFPLFLKNKIQEHYKRCLQDSVFMDHVSGLKNAFLDKETLQPDLQNN